MEAIWIQDTLTEALNQHAKPIQLTPYSKRWWGTQVKEARGTYARARKLWQTGTIGDAKHQEARKAYYVTIQMLQPSSYYVRRPEGGNCWQNNGIGNRHWYTMWYTLV